MERKDNDVREEQIKADEIVVNRVTVDEVTERLRKGEPLAFVDSRSDESWNKAGTQIPGSIRVPPDRPGAAVASVPKDRSVITYCT